MNLEDLVARARAARALAYAPYSGYLVGAAVLGADGEVRTGTNVENISFGLTVCAERSAVTRMVGDGCREIKAVAVSTRDGGTPCGMCLQTLLEFAPDPARVAVVCADDSGQRHAFTLAELIPHGFRSKSVKQSD